MAGKRFYWLKLREDFFRQKDIKKLRQIAGGDTFTIIYLKLLLRSLENDGKLFYDGVEEDFASEMALDIDERVEDVQMTVQFLAARGILQRKTEEEYELLTAAEMTGSESDSAGRMRNHRNRQLSQCDEIPSLCDRGVTQCDTEIESEPDIRNREKKQNNGRAGKPPRSSHFIPPTVEEVAQYCQERESVVDAQEFVDFYASKGWMIGKDPMKDWKAAVRTWERREKKNRPESKKFRTAADYRKDVEDCF